MICGADNWVEIEEFGNARLEWLSRFLRLPNGIPSHDTFGRVFSRLDPDQFGACFMNWARSVAELTQGEVVAIDGKTLRRCHDRGQGRAPLHLVSAWAAQNHLVLGQNPHPGPFQRNHRHPPVVGAAGVARVHHHH